MAREYRGCEEKSEKIQRLLRNARETLWEL